MCLCECFCRRKYPCTEKVDADLAKLKESGFGLRWPRHGLPLLHYVACKLSKSKMNLFFCPASGDYGFHEYENKPARNGRGKLLPTKNGLTYYSVGNPKIKSGKPLPDYIFRDYTGKHDDSNMDRVIIGVDKRGRVRKVYASEHYNPDATVEVSTETLMYISSLSLEEFLSEMGYESA